MAHYAFLNDDNVVVKVIIGIDENDTSTLPSDFSSWEEWYGNAQDLTCKRTSYNTYKNTHREGGTAFRGNYAGIGIIYNSDNDVFIEPQVYDSWILDETTWTWEPPVDQPELTEEQIADDKQYTWNENIINWELTNI